MNTRNYITLCALSLILISAGCGQDRRERLDLPAAVEEGSASAPAGTNEPAPDPSTYMERILRGGSLGGGWTLKEIRRGRHENFFRVVLEFEAVDGAGNGAPYHEIQEVYNSHPFPESEDGRAVIDGTWGDARIDIRLSDVRGGSFFTRKDSPLPWTIDESRNVTKLGMLPLFDDAIIGFSIGLNAPAPYEARFFPDPPRLIIDITES